MNQTLYLLRHAKAEPWYPGVNDFSRPLSDKGNRHMANLCPWAVERIAAPEAVLCSSSTRTRETIEPFLGIWPGVEDRTTYTDEIYEASTGTLHELAMQAFQTASSVMMVGHNPGFEYLALAVMSDADANRIAKMATGTLAVIEFAGGYEADAGNGQLRHWITRKDFSGN